MKLIEFDHNKTKKTDDQEEKPDKMSKRKKVIITTIILLVMVVISASVIIYISNKEFRDFIDIHILNKEIQENNVNMISLAEEKNPVVYAYNNNITILEKNKLKIYNSSGNETSQIDIEIAAPIFADDANYLVAAEKNGQRLYLISANTILWDIKVDGNINKICVNKNGYVSAVVSGTIYKSVIITYDKDGNEIFKKYLSNTIAMDIDISDDNKYLGYGEIDISGTLIKSKVTIIDIEKAKQISDGSYHSDFEYEAPDNSLLMHIRYQSKNKLICYYNDNISVIQDNANKKLIDLEKKEAKISFADIELNNHICYIREIDSNIITTTNQLEILNTDNEKINIYMVEGVVRELYCQNSKIAINLGNEIHFIDLNGWLVKKYKSTKDIRNIVMNDGVAGIIYKNRIELIQL